MFAIHRHRSTAPVIGRRSRRHRRLITLEGLEERIVLSPWLVTKSVDDGSSGTLRWAIGQANAEGGGSTITFDPTAFATAQTITLSSASGFGTLNLTEAGGTETIQGPTAGVTISGGNAVRVFDVSPSVTASLSGLTIAQGSVAGLGNHGKVELTNCTISGNAGFYGGGLAAYAGTMTLAGCTISGNHASINGGGLFVFSSGTANLTNCTFSGNDAENTGGGLVTNPGGTSQLTACTISGNAAGHVGGLASNYNTTLKDTIVAGNTSPDMPDIRGAYIADHCLIGGSPQLAPLGDYGGPTQTMALLPGSPAIGAGIAAPGVTTDQRGFALDAPVDIGAYQAVTVPLVVAVATDGVGAPPAELDLRAAINLANIQPGGTTVTFDPTVFSTPQTITLSSASGFGTLNLTEAGGTEAIQGPAAGVTISGGDAVQVFNVSSGVTASLSDVTISGGSTTGSGGGLSNAGTVSLIRCTLSANSASWGGGGILNTGTATVTDSILTANFASGFGGGILNNGGTATVTDSILTANSSSNFAGGIYNQGTATVTDSILTANFASYGGGGIVNYGTATVTDSTLTANSASNYGGGIYNDYGGATIVNSTIASNTVGGSGAGGGLYRTNGTTRLDNTIVASNILGASTPSDIAGSVDTANSYNNLIGTGGSGGITNGPNGNIVLTDLSHLGLAALASNGGPTQTMALQAGSWAIDAGSASIPGVTVPTIDQRGAMRGPAGLNAGSHPDIGAYEASSSYLVTSTLDDGSVGTLRAAVGWANVNLNTNPVDSPPAPNTIDFNLPASSTINLETALPALSNTSRQIAIAGPGASSLTVERDPTLPNTTQFSAFAVNFGATVAVSGLTIAHGLVSNGGGIYNVGTATITDSTLSHNSAGFGGGGIYNVGTVTVTDSTLSHNSASNYGGGLLNAGGTATVTDSTLFDNTASYDGGGLFNDNGTATVTDSTLSHNSASYGGGIYNWYGTATVTVTDSTLSDNSASFGGGIYNDYSGMATVTDSTISHNSAYYDGGGIVNHGMATVTDSTLSANSANAGGGIVSLGTATVTDSTISHNSAYFYGGGIYMESGAATYLADTIIARNILIGAGSGPDIYGAVNSLGYNLIGDTSGGSGFVSTDLRNTDPMLAPLGNYGGPTQTMALLPGSPAIGWAQFGSVTTDQRGAPRPTSNFDIGAFQDQGYTLAVSSGSGQHAVITQPFASPLVARLTENYAGGQPIPGATITFTAPSSGAGATLTGSPATTDTSGLASVAATANATAGGPYGVTASTTGVTSTSFSLTNDRAVPLFIGLVAPTSITYGAASISLSGQLSAPISFPAGETISITIGTATGTADLQSNGQFSTTFATSSLHASSTPYAITFTYAGDDNLTGASDGSRALTINKATPTITWANPADITYGTALSGTQLNAAAGWTVGGSPVVVPGTFTYTPPAGTVLHAGAGQLLSTSFVPDDATDYNTTAATTHIDVMKATPTIAWADPADIVYGTALSGTQLNAAASWIVGGSPVPVAGTFTYLPASGTVLHAGAGQLLSTSFAPPDTTDYNGTSASAHINVGKATPTMTWADPADIVYGTALSGAQLDASASWTVGGVVVPVEGAFTYDPAAGTVLHAGSGQLLSTSFAPTNSTDYNTAPATAHIDVLKATPTIAWADPSDIVYGTALSGTQLDATASWVVGGTPVPVAGTFTYDPSSGTILHAGADQLLSTSFAPTDPGDYNGASASAHINVARATPTIAWSNPADIVYGTALSGAQLDASASWVVGGVVVPVAGAFTYDPAAGTVLHAGSGQLLSTSFAPDDASDYDTASAVAHINVARATPTITWADPADIVYGTALSGAQLDAAASWVVGGGLVPVAGTFTYDPSSGTVLHAGAGQVLSTSFAPTDAGDYNGATATAHINVGKATPTMTWADPADIVYGTALSGAQLDASASWVVGGVVVPVGGAFTYDPAAGTVLHAGAGQVLSTSFAPTDASDYNAATATTHINVGKATPTIAWSNPADIVYGTALSDTQLDAAASWVVGGSPVPVAGAFTYDPAAGTVLHAGSGQVLSTSFAPTDTIDYNTATATTHINVLKATPTITWADPADIVYGTALSGAQLDAAASWIVGGTSVPVYGVFTYDPSSGTVLHAGSGQLLATNFAPSDATDYNNASATAHINVVKATPTIAWADPADIVYGTALSDTQLDASASWVVGGTPVLVAGAFTYDPAAGTVLHAGSSQLLSTSFVPADAIDYNDASAVAHINVLKATPTFSDLSPSTSIVYGTAALDVTGKLTSPTAIPVGQTVTVAIAGESGSALVGLDGSFSASVPTAAIHASATPYTIAYAFAGSGDFVAAGDTSTTLTVTRATPTIAWADPADIVYGTALSGTQLDATASVPGSFAYTPAAGTVLGAGAHQALRVAFTPTDSVDYNSASATAHINVARASLTVTANNLSKPYGATLTFAGTEFTSSGLIAGDSVSSVSLGSAGAPSSAAVGGYPIVASDAVGTGLANYDISYVPGTLSVARAGTTTVMVTTGGSSVYGQPTSFTVQVTSAVPGFIPSGAVTFYIDGAAVGTVGLNAGGQATLSDPAMAVGGHTIAAWYLGGASYSASPSGSIPWQVNQASTSNLLTISRHGNKIWLTAGVAPVAPGGGTPSGTISFYRANGKLMGVNAVSGNSATLILGRSYCLNKTFWAKYNGSSSFLSSETARIQVTNRTMARPAAPARPSLARQLTDAARSAVSRLSEAILGVLPSFTDKKAR